MKEGPVLKEIPRLYEGCHAVIAAPGPSLTPEVVDILEEFKDKYAIFGVGDVYRRIPFLDELYACDARWWDIHGKEVNKTIPNTRLWTYQPEGRQYGAHKIDGVGKEGFSTKQDKIHFGSNSGYQMLNLAYLWGCRRMILVGYNMQKVGNESHFFGERHKSLAVNSPYNIFQAKFATIQKDIRERVVNCTPNSALNMFKKADLRETLCEL